MTPRIWLSRPHMGGAELDHVHAAFASNFVAPTGPQLAAFETALSDRLEGCHCVALASGSAALHLALRIAGVRQGDEVWVSSMTFAGGIFPVLYEGATPVFLDLNPASWTLDPLLVANALDEAARIGRLPRAVVPTDLYGSSVDLDPIEAACAHHGVALLVDSAESLGALYRSGRPAGTGGDAAVLSFNGNKIITTSGGGMLVTRHADWARQAQFLATQARDPAPHYQHSTYGYNYRLSNVCAAIGLGQLEVLDRRVEARRTIFARYAAALEPLGVQMMPEPEGQRSTRWLTAVALPRGGPDREHMRLALAEEGIEARPLWKPMHLQPVFDGARYIGSGVDVDLFDRGLCLPSGSDLTESEQKEVIGVISRVMESG